MKVLHVYKTYYPYSYGGIEKFIDTLSVSSVKHGVQNTLMTCAPCKKISEDHTGVINKYYYPTTFEKFSCPVSIALLSHFRSQVNQHDLIHFHFPWPFADIAMMMSRVNKPYVVTYHSDIIRQKIIKPFYSPIMNYFLKRANKVIATSENYVKSSAVLKKLNNVSVIPIALNDAFTSSSQITSEKPYFLFLGALRQYKGLHYLVEAMRGVDQFDLMIAGDGPCFSELTEMIHRYQLSNVKLLGKVDEATKWKLFSHAYGVVSSAHLRNEAYCYMLVEGLMFGKPLISTELNTGTSYVNAQGETGIVVPPENSAALREAMLKLFFDQVLAEKYGQNARARFLDLFTADKMSQSYFELYHQVLSNQKR